MQLSCIKNRIHGEFSANYQSAIVAQRKLLLQKVQHFWNNLVIMCDWWESYMHKMHIETKRLNNKRGRQSEMKKANSRSTST